MYDAGPYQIWRRSDALMESYGILDFDPKGENINFLRYHGLSLLSRAFLHQFFIVPGLLGCVLFASCTAFIQNVTSCQLPRSALTMHCQSRHYLFETFRLDSAVLHDATMLLLWSMLQTFLESNG
jgi:hypothetical protein